MSEGKPSAVRKAASLGVYISEVSGAVYLASLAWVGFYRRLYRWSGFDRERALRVERAMLEQMRAGNREWHDLLDRFVLGERSASETWKAGSKWHADCIERSFKAFADALNDTDGDMRTDPVV